MNVDSSIDYGEVFMSRKYVRLLELFIWSACILIEIKDTGQLIKKLVN